jgi:hypothetical protein
MTAAIKGITINERQFVLTTVCEKFTLIPVLKFLFSSPGDDWLPTLVAGSDVFPMLGNDVIQKYIVCAVSILLQDAASVGDGEPVTF